jgi:hypothetical protein
MAESNWNSKLVVSVAGAVVSPIDTFVPTFTIPRTVIHSIEQDRVGSVAGPRTATFTMTMKAIGAPVAAITQLALSGTEFSISVAVQSGNDWSFKQLLFRSCLITSANPSNVSTDVPAASFNGIILGFGESGDIE